MNEEQTKRLAEAAESLLQAASAVEDARDAVNDRRFDSEADRDRSAAATQMANRIDSAAKRLDDAIHKGTVASAALARPGAYQRYREAAAAAREGRVIGRASQDQDGSSNKRESGQRAVERLDAALATAAVIVFGE
jgi:hypothetical protein